VATDQVLKLSRVKVYDIRKERALAFVDEVEKSINVEVVASDSVQEAVQGADVVVTTTTADEPLIKASWLEPGVFLAKIGSYQELELEVLLQVDKLVVDNWDYVSRRSKEITTLMQKGVLSKENTYLLPEIVAGKVKGRESDEERILLIHLGFAAKYGATGPYVYNRAIELGLGRWLPQLW
jgi:ornithine cyclodeaminase/alanine dehydrogenase-like protein (mu-crystallin family)